MLWAIVQHRKPLSSMTLEDCEAYRDFLADPTPRDKWCVPRGRDKWSTLWRPFEGPLSRSAQAHAVRVLKSLYTFLVDQCCLIGNPWKGVGMQRVTRVAVARGRSFTQVQWAFIEQQAAQLTDRSADRRLRFALHLYYATGMRLVEGVQARVDDLRLVSYADQASDEVISGWEMTVLGEGNKERIVQVPQEVIDELACYLASRGQDPDPKAIANRGTYLLGQVVDVASRAPWSPRSQQTVDPKAGISHVTMYEAIKRFLSTARRSWLPPSRKAPNAWHQPPRTGCGIPTARMRLRPGCRWMWCSRTWAMRRWIQPRATPGVRNDDA